MRLRLRGVQIEQAGNRRLPAKTASPLVSILPQGGRCLAPFHGEYLEGQVAPTSLWQRPSPDTQNLEQGLLASLSLVEKNDISYAYSMRVIEDSSSPCSII